MLKRPPGVSCGLTPSPTLAEGDLPSWGKINEGWGSFLRGALASQRRGMPRSRAVLQRKGWLRKGWWHRWLVAPRSPSRPALPRGEAVGERRGRRAGAAGAAVRFWHHLLDRSFSPAPSRNAAAAAQGSGAAGAVSAAPSPAHPQRSLGQGTAAAHPLDPHLPSPSASLHGAQLIAPRSCRARLRTRAPSHRSHLAVRPLAPGAHCSLGAPRSRGEARNPLKQEGAVEQRG